MMTTVVQTRSLLYRRFATTANRTSRLSFAGTFLLALLIGPSSRGITFSTLTSFFGTNGAQPIATMVLGTNGSFYGTTLTGGASNNGTIFVVNSKGGLTNLYSFSGPDGSQPSGAMVQGTNGDFYGTTASGGTNNLGTFFVITPSGTFSNLASFDGTNGSQPFGPLARGTDGNFYGTTVGGGAFGNGTLFVVRPNGTLTTLVSFDGTNGSSPFGGLVTQTTNNTFYGTTASGGNFNAGTVFSLRTGASTVSTNIPVGTNIIATNIVVTNIVATNIVVTNIFGGTNIIATNIVVTNIVATNIVVTNMVTTNMVVTNMAFSSLYSFTGGADGAGPQGALTIGTNGNVYGTTAGGGTNNVGRGGYGTVFEITSSGSFTNLASFAGTNGSIPFAPLVQASDGNFYGTATSGGGTAQTRGTVFVVRTNGIVRLHAFTGPDGANPSYAGLVMGTNGSLYGTTSSGGAGGAGTIFALSGFPPTIVSQPGNLTAPAGATVTFTVEAGGSQPLSYRWRKNSNSLSDGGRFFGTHTSMLTIENVNIGDSGTYQVVVANSVGSVTNSGALLTVIPAYGTNIPVARITSPAAGAIVLHQLFTVQGVASSAVPIASVFVQLNDGSPQLATPNTGWSQWSAKVTLSPGINVLQAYAVNIVGTASMINQVTFTCGKDGFTPISVQVNGNGKASPNYNQVWLQQGRTYSMNAIPAAGNLFASWSQTLSTNAPVVTDKPLVTFTARTNLLLVANFIPNPFIPVSGVYNGLFSDTNGVSVASAGFFTLTVNSKGSFSGNLQTAAARYSMSGLFDTNGSARTVARHQSSQLGVALQLDMTNGTDEISGTVSNQTFTAELEGDRSVFDGHKSISPLAGQFTMVLPGTNDPSVAPGGDGFATMTVDKAGKIHASFSLADVTAFGQTVPVSKNGQWPLFGKLYGGRGLLLGFITLSNVTSSNAPNELTGQPAWIKPAFAKSKFYPDGFTNQQVALGSHFNPPGPNTNIITLTNVTGTLEFSGAGLINNITNQIFLGPKDKVTVLSGPKLTMNFNRSTGLMHGTVAETEIGGPNLISFSGVVLQSNSVARGFLIRNNLTGPVLLH
jgi:uncharacterized repeat protein (TIGR03803 family)